MIESTCVIHRDRRATYSVQGILVDDECYQRYRAEYDGGPQHAACEQAVFAGVDSSLGRQI